MQTVFRNVLHTKTFVPNWSKIIRKSITGDILVMTITSAKSEVLWDSLSKTSSTIIRWSVSHNSYQWFQKCHWHPLVNKKRASDLKSCASRESMLKDKSVMRVIYFITCEGQMTDRYIHDVIKWKYLPRYWPFVPVNGAFPAQRPVTRSFDVYFDLRPSKPLSKQSWGWWFETSSRSLWRHCNVERQTVWATPSQ